MKIFSSFALVALVALAVPRALAVPEGGEELPVHKKTLKEIVYEKSHAVGKPKFPRGPRSRGLKQRGASSTDTAHRALGKSGGKGGFDSCCELLESLSKIEAKCYDVIREYSVYEISAEYLGCEEDLNIRKGSEDPALYLEEKYYKYQEEFYDEIYSLFDGDEEDFSEKLSCLSQLANLVYSDIDTSFGLELYCIDDYENCECECYCNPGNCLVVAEPVQIEQEPLMMVEDNCDEVCECM